MGEELVIGESIAVPHRDPDRWGLSSPVWVPLSQTHFATLDKERWARVMFISPDDRKPEVDLALDRFRNDCRRRGIEVRDADPQWTSGGD